MGDSRRPSLSSARHRPFAPSAPPRPLCSRMRRPIAARLPLIAVAIRQEPPFTSHRDDSPSQSGHARSNPRAQVQHRSKTFPAIPANRETANNNKKQFNKIRNNNESKRGPQKPCVYAVSRPWLSRCASVAATAAASALRISRAHSGTLTAYLAAEAAAINARIAIAFDDDAHATSSPTASVRHLTPSVVLSNPAL